MDTRLFTLSLERLQDPWGQLLSETPGEEGAGLHKAAEPKRVFVLGGERGAVGPSGSLSFVCDAPIGINTKCVALERSDGLCYVNCRTLRSFKIKEMKIDSRAKGP